MTACKVFQFGYEVNDPITLFRVKYQVITAKIIDIALASQSDIFASDNITVDNLNCIVLVFGKFVIHSTVP